MNEQVLSLRLKKVGEKVPQGARLADIGSDHAYLPSFLTLNGKISYAVAGEVVKGPYESAKKQVAKNLLSEKIIVRLANGLAAIHEDDHIDAITIAGMGGTLIRQILENGLKQGQLKKNETLILQPNIGERTLREWLMLNGYGIVDEEILEENDKIYEIIVAEPMDSVHYSEKELLFGPILLQNKTETFIKKWQREVKAKERVLGDLQKAQVVPQEKIKEVEEQLAWIKEVLA